MSYQSWDWNRIKLLEAACSATYNYSTLLRASADHFRATGIEIVSYRHHPPLGAIDRTNGVFIYTEGLPDAWKKRYYAEKFYKIDPVSRLAAERSTSFLWSDTSSLIKLREGEAWYLEQLANNIPGDGLIAPVYGPHGRDGYFLLGLGKPDETFTHLEIKFLEHSCQAIHSKYCELVFDKLPSNTKLSPRETAVLKLVSIGSSSSSIADELNITANTVDTYIQRIFHKLDVDHRVTAVLRAQAIGLLN